MNASSLTNLNHDQSGASATEKTEVIPLRYPLSVDGMTFEHLTMRRPLVRDRLTAEKAKCSDSEKEIHLIANLCDMAPHHIELLDLADYTRLQECLAGFLS